MPHIFGAVRSEVLLFPEAIDDYITDNNPVRFIDAFVESLDLVALGFTHAMPAATGRPAYSPADLLRLYIYGYLNRVRSSRLLEREAERNVEVMWLIGKLTPDQLRDYNVSDFDVGMLPRLQCQPADRQRVRYKASP